MFQLVFNTENIVAWCSKLFTLLPGDLILTGTPPGVGVFMKPPEFLKASSHGKDKNGQMAVPNFAFKKCSEKNAYSLRT